MTTILQVRPLLAADRIRVGLPGGSKEEVIHALVDLFTVHPAVHDLEAVRRAVFQREQTMSTGVGKGVGLPHAKTPYVGETLAAFAVLATPVEFGAIDDIPVRLLFLLLGPEGTTTHHIKVMGRVSRLMNQESFREALVAAKDAEEVLLLFEQAEAHLAEGEMPPSLS